MAMAKIGSDSASVRANKATLCLMIALAVASSSFAVRVLDEKPMVAPPVEAPLPVDPLPVPTEPPVDPVVVTAAVPVALPLPSNAVDGAEAGAGTGSVGSSTGNHPLTFFMHDTLSGSQQSVYSMTGVVAPPQVATSLINSNNEPSVSSLGVSSDNLFQNNGNTINAWNKNTPLVNAGDLPSGAALQNLLFGATTIIDDDLTEAYDLGAMAIGRAHGFYITSSSDGTSKMIVLTAMFEGEGHGDTVRLFGVYQMAAPESHLAINGGTGKYENAKGFATVQTVHRGDQHSTDGVETLLQFNIHLS